LNKTSHLNKTLSLCDAQGTVHSLHLDKLEFVIQRKAELAFKKIDSLMRNKDIEGAEQAIDKLLKLNLSLYQKGFRNRDPNFRSNCGFIQDEAILIDVGRMVYSEEIKEPKKFKQDLLKSSLRFRKYIEANHPELLSYFDNAIAKITQSEDNRSYSDTPQPRREVGVSE